MDTQGAGMNARSWHAVNLGASDAPEVRALFAQVFGQPMSDALWQWKYADGRGLATGTRNAEGSLIAHYGGTARTLVWDGQERPAVQLGDVMVMEQARGILSRNGAFATAAQSFLQQHVGAQTSFAIGFGFPNERAARLGQALRLYETLGEIHALEWRCPQPDPGRRTLRRWATAPLDWADPGTQGRLDALWQALRSDARHFVLPRRDANWWRHRFANHPDGPYRLWWVRHRFTRSILGAVVLRPGAETWEIIDWLAPLRHTETVLAAARALAASAGASALTGWFSAPLAAQLATMPAVAGFRSQLACTNCVTVARDPSLTPEMLSRPWWLTGGDTDFR